MSWGSECLPQKDNGDNDFHVLTVCAEIITMKEKVIVILKWYYNFYSFIHCLWTGDDDNNDDF